MAFICILLAGCIAETPEGTPGEGVSNASMEKDMGNITAPEPAVQAPADNQTQNNSTTEVITSETVFPPEPVFDFNYTDENGTLRVFFFHSPGCSACRDSYPIISELEGKFPNVSFINYSLATPNGSKAYVKFAELHNLSTQKQMVPQVLVNGTIITDRFNIEEKLEPLLENLTK